MQLSLPGPCHKDIAVMRARASLRAQYIDLSSFLQDDAVQGPSQRKMKLSLLLELLISPKENRTRKSLVMSADGWPPFARCLLLAARSAS